ncbi:MAG: helix-turn-helix domain-containing protein [Caenibius sp.]
MADIQPIAVDEMAAANITGISVSSLQKMRVRGGGPPYAKVGNRVRYRIVDLEAFMAERVRNSTSEAA